MAGIPDDYNTVPERIAEFKDKYPNGSFQPAYPERPWEILTVGGQSFIAYAAAAYRHSDDKLPGIGTAWEPVPGPTAFTRNSELQNAETSAWGRAIVAALAADAKKGIATADEIRNRRAEHEQGYDQPPATGGPKVCTRCGASLVGAKVERDGDGWAHKGDCPEAAS